MHWTMHERQVIDTTISSPAKPILDSSGGNTEGLYLRIKSLSLDRGALAIRVIASSKAPANQS